IWVSEIMLQQTRVETAIPFYEKFLRRFPSVEALAEAPEADVLACWSGLGYYSRARNLRKAAIEIAKMGRFPHEFDAIRSLPGVGAYTAAAVASIAFGLPHAVVDGNVLRVISRIANDAGDIGAPATLRRFQAIADGLLNGSDPGHFNQAMMELGATLCLSRSPRCPLCPVRRHCRANQEGAQNALPVKSRPGAMEKVEVGLALLERGGRVLLKRRAADARRMAGFWELPALEEVPELRSRVLVGVVRHTIVRQRFTYKVYSGELRRTPGTFQWMERNRLATIPVTTVTRKALALVFESESSLRVSGSSV
ncbi:MAG: A/G-specific adenine glycosylase, partial [Acidobacteriota bacterium]|nr:A/G-specific adenine glycosylase [Acidobacteriota bacterium]